ncbi:MAG TPA: hypothetical protein PLH11_08125 [Gemmobacter sp.]|nr:hypothetical protein [Gemmobacter sp.]
MQRGARQTDTKIHQGIAFKRLIATRRDKTRQHSGGGTRLHLPKLKATGSLQMLSLHAFFKSIRNALLKLQRPPLAKPAHFWLQTRQVSIWSLRVL